MPESKIQIRARIMKTISSLKSVKAVSDNDVEAAIKALSDVEDKAFLCTTILKEINGSINYFDGILAILAINLAKGVMENCIFTFLNDSKISDSKKMFLINTLSQLGKPVDTNLIHAYIENPDEAIDSETEKFLKMAEIDPEAQIDFLDFYFGINEKDRDILLDSIISDYQGDMLANILAPLIYSINDKDILLRCIDAFLKSKSYLSYPCLNWLIETSKDQHIVSSCRKTIKELKIAGLRKNVPLNEYFKDKLKDSKPISFWVSPLDGNSNFSYVFARQNNNSTVSTFFAVLNPNEGAVSCFGLSSISGKEFDTVLKRFFLETEMIKLPFDAAVSLLNSISDINYKKGYEVPYELLCWRQITYDIKPLDVSMDEYMLPLLKKITVSELDLKRLINSEFLANWFYRYSDSSPKFKALIDDICLLTKDNFGLFNEITERFIESVFEEENEPVILKYLKVRIVYQSFILNMGGFKNLSSSLYSVMLDAALFKKLFKYIIQKSVYEYFQNLSYIKKSENSENIFRRKREIKHFDFEADVMVELIEKKWIK